MSEIENKLTVERQVLSAPAKGKPGRPRKMTHHPETGAAITSAVEAREAKRAADRLYAAARRKELKQEAEIDKGIAGASDAYEFWAASRKSLEPDKLAAMLERQEAVKDTVDWMKCQMDGSYNDPTSKNYVDPTDDLHYVSLEEGFADLLADISEHGLTETLVAQLPFFWKHDDIFAKLTSPIQACKATPTFARYGIVVGVPSHLYHDFQNFLKTKYRVGEPSSIVDPITGFVDMRVFDYKPTPTAPNLTEKFVQITCVNAGRCKSLPTMMAMTEVQRFQKIGGWRCASCVLTQADNQSHVNSVIYTPPITDEWGRFK